MSAPVVAKPAQSLSFGEIEKVLIRGDLTSLNEQQRVAYYNKVCEVVGLNPLTRPFDYIKLQGKEILYANKGCAEQLRMIHKIGIKITARETIEGVYVVTSQASSADGREDASTGAVSVQGLKGEALANAFMKAETKSKRRVTLSICGLNMLDETEVESVSAQPTVVPQQPAVEDGIQFDTGAMKVGQWAKRHFGEIERMVGLEEMQAWHKKAELRMENAKAVGKPIPNEQLWYHELERMAAYIAEREMEMATADAEPGWSG